METIFSNMYERFGDVNTKVAEPVARVNEIAARANALMVQKQMEVMETSMEAGVKQLQTLGQFKNPAEMMAAQAELAKTVGEKWVSAAQEVLAIQLKARDELNSLFMDSWKPSKPASETNPVAKATPRTSRKAA